MKKEIFTYLTIAGKIALHGEYRNFYLGAVAVRGDGAIVKAYNTKSKVPNPAAHAEFKLCKKIDVGCTVYVARVNRDGRPAMAKPGPSCMQILKNSRVSRVYYTIGPNEFGRIDL